MKAKRIATAAAVVALFGAQLGSTNAFASNYGIEYSGGEPLSASNVNINPDLINSLVPLIRSGSFSTTVAPSGTWKSGYISGSEGCNPAYYFSVSSNGHVALADPKKGETSSSSPRFSISNGKYRADVEIIAMDFNGEVEPTDDGEIAFAVRTNTNYVYVGWQIYTDSTCQTVDDNIYAMPEDSADKLFIEMRSTLYKEGVSTPYLVDGMYFGITDIDSAQSYKILNTGNEFTPDNMIAVSESVLQPGPNGYRNMYVSNGNYIYSEYSTDGSHVLSNNKANVYVELNQNTQREGTDFVFGFAGRAASGIEYLGRLYNVQYTADKHGEITGITDEDVFPGDRASGSSYEASSSYTFQYWIADVDVVLEDNTRIKAGDPISNDQIKKVVVDKDIVFTAVFDDLKVPNTGMFTGDTNATITTISLVGVTLGALAIGLLPRLHHKKIGFKK